MVEQVMTFTITSTFDGETYSASYTDNGIALNEPVMKKMAVYAVGVDDLWTRMAMVGPAKSYVPEGDHDEVGLYANLLEFCPGEKQITMDFEPPAWWAELDVIDMGPLVPATPPPATDDLSGTVTKVLPANVTPDGEAHSGAMIALMPRADQLVNLQVAGGFPADELHLTLMYMGDGVNFPESSRDVVRAIISTLDLERPPITAEIAGAGNLGPDAVVYLVGDSPVMKQLGDKIAQLMWDAQSVVAADTVLGFNRRDPWIPHLTAGEAPGVSVAQLTYRGSVIFDRIRVAFEGTYTDFPFVMYETIDPAEFGITGPLVSKELVVEDDSDEDSSGSLNDLALKMMFSHLPDLDAAADAIEAFYRKDVGSADPRAARLRHYWTRGAGAAKIRWGTPGDFKRAVKHLRKFVGARAEGLAAIYHRSALGVWPGREHGHKSDDAAESLWEVPGAHQYVKMLTLDDTIMHINQ